MRTFKEIYLALKFCFSYFSNLPVKISSEENINNPVTLKYTVYFIPSVGFCLSSIIVIIYDFFYPSLYFAILLSILYMILYGFIHTEAVVDVVDALYAKHSGKDPYLIIKEPGIGAMGMLYGISFLIAKISTVAILLINGLYLELIAASAVSRTTVIYAIYFFKYKSTFVNILKEHLKLYEITAALAIYGIIIYSLIGISVLYLFLFSIIFTFAVLRVLNKKLGFLNGDTVGFNIESVELTLMILSVIFLTSF